MTTTLKVAAKVAKSHVKLRNIESTIDNWNIKSSHNWLNVNNLEVH